MQLNQFKESLFREFQINLDDRIIVGVSGGADSICLLDLLQRSGCSLVVAHFNHHLRTEAEQDLQFVKEIAKSRGLSFIQGGGDVRRYAKIHHKTIEEAARICRYDFLFQQAYKRGIKFVAVGHTASDQAETILMHLLRGCGLSGLQGMLPVTSLGNYPNIKLIRPLLCFWKEDVLAYCRQNHLNYKEDRTNNDPNYFRNRLRLELIPTLREYNPNVEQHLVNMGEIARRDLALINQYTMNHYRQCLLEETPDYVSLSRIRFLETPNGLKQSILRHAFQKLSSSTIELNFNLTERMVDFIQNAIIKNPLPLVSGYELLLEGDFIYLYSKGAVLPFQYYPCMDPSLIKILKFPGVTKINHLWSVKTGFISREDVAFQFSHGQLIYEAYLNAEKINSPLQMKCQKPGDRFSPLGLGGKKQKLSDFWVNKKIPKRFRSTWPLLFHKNEIVWIPGFQPSHLFRVMEDTLKIIKVELIKN